MKNANRKGFYLHEVQVKEKLLDVFKTGVVTGTSGAPKGIIMGVVGRVKDIEKICSKIGESLQNGSNAWGIKGYKQNGEKSSADDRRRALNLAESYAPDSFGGLKEVGAALEHAISRQVREYKQNNAYGTGGCEDYVQTERERREASKGERKPPAL